MMANNRVHEQRGSAELNNCTWGGGYIMFIKCAMLCSGVWWAIGSARPFIRNYKQRFYGFVCAKKRQ